MARRGLVVVGLAMAVAFMVVFMRAPDAPPIPDRDLGLRKTALDDDRVPSAVTFPDASPGENALLVRAYDGAPPLVPHSLDGMLPITATDNFCLLCHATGSTDPEDPPQAPSSHFMDLRAAPTVVREEVAGARWNCTACHVVQSDAPVLVENSFSSAVKK